MEHYLVFVIEISREMAERKPTVNALEAAADELDRPPTAN
jgi:hypothetical protein